MMPIRTKFYLSTMLSYTRTALQMPVFFYFFVYAKIQNYKMKLVYLPLLAVNNISFLQHLLFGLALVYVSVKILYFHQVLAQKNTKQKSYAKSFTIV